MKERSLFWRDFPSWSRLWLERSVSWPLAHLSLMDWMRWRELWLADGVLRMWIVTKMWRTVNEPMATTPSATVPIWNRFRSMMCHLVTTASSVLRICLLWNRSWWEHIHSIMLHSPWKVWNVMGLRTDLPSLRSIAFGDYAFFNAPSVVLKRNNELLEQRGRYEVVEIVQYQQ